MASASAQVDLLTGQAQSYYFFDPDDAIGLRQEQDDDWREEQLYVPGALVEQSASSPTTPPSSTDEVRLRLATGEVVRVTSMGLQRVDPQDTIGVPDILLLNNFSEKSLLHTLRVRYEPNHFQQTMCT